MVIRNRFLTFILFLACFFSTSLTAYDSADISLIVVDFKYNKEQGVKICEIQPVRISMFKGSAFVRNDDEYLPRRLYEVLSQYTTSGWVHSYGICDKQIPQFLKEHGWHTFEKIKDLTGDSTFGAKATHPLYNPNDLLSYQTVLYASKRHINTPECFKEKYPGVLLIDKAVEPYCKGKKTLNTLFNSDEKLKKFRPRSQCYPKKYSKELVEKIHRDINSEAYVIKPTNQAKGRGVIIVSRDKLKKTLKTILKHKKELERHKDEIYRYWGRDKSKVFLIEEFVSSDSVAPSHLNSRPYDGTMRAVIVLVYNNHEISLSVIEKYWKLPKYSLVDKGSLNDLYKSCGKAPFFYHVDPDTDEAVEKQLTEGITLLYQKILGAQK